MITKLKVCLIGATGVGKTSLASRYVHSIFSESYRTTIGVKIETVEVTRSGRPIQLVIWDMSGEDEFQSVHAAYLSGAAGYLLVVDGTRNSTIDTGLVLARRVSDTVGSIPFVLVVNKADLVASWDVRAEDIAPLRQLAAGFVRTSALTGVGVREAFEQLADAIVMQVEPHKESPWT